MKIQFCVHPNTGISYHRFILPMEFTPFAETDQVEMLWIGEDEHKIDCDILMYNKFIQTDYKILEGLKKNGTKIVVDVDDYWELHPSHPNYDVWNKRENGEKTLNNIKIADLVICTTMHLQEKVREYNKNTVVIPNALPFGKEHYVPTPQENQKMGFIYSAGSTHLPDAEMLRGKFKRIGSDQYIKDNAEFIMAGYNPTYIPKYHTKEDWKLKTHNFTNVKVTNDLDRIVNIFSLTGSHRILPATNQDDYINYYDQAKVSLIPLQATTWNSYKSELKVIEAACKGLPVICSNVMPYNVLRPCEGVMWVDTPDDWLKYIRYCIKNPEYVKDMGMKLNEWVSKEYDLVKWGETRLQVYKSLMG